MKNKTYGIALVDVDRATFKESYLYEPCNMTRKKARKVCSKSNAFWKSVQSKNKTYVCWKNEN